MTVTLPPEDRGPASLLGHWRDTGPGQPACGVEHGGAGSIDESARRLSHEEFAVASLLASEGHHVTSLSDGRRGGRTADLAVCGRPVEVKSWLPTADRDGRIPGPRSVLNKLIDASGQADAVVLYAERSGLRASTAELGLRLYADRHADSKLADVRVLGDGFDLARSRRPEAVVARRPEAVVARRPEPTSTQADRADRFQLSL